MYTTKTKQSTINDLMDYADWQRIVDQIDSIKAEASRLLGADTKAWMAHIDEFWDRISHGNHSGPAHWVINAVGERELVCDGFKHEVTPAPYVGMPATIILYTDTMAAVVTKVCGKSIMIASVATGEEVVVGSNGPWPNTRAEGMIDQINGTPERYTLNKWGRFSRGSIGLLLGDSYRYINYSF